MQNSRYVLCLIYMVYIIKHIYIKVNWIIRNNHYPYIGINVFKLLYNEISVKYENELQT